MKFNIETWDLTLVANLVANIPHNGVSSYCWHHLGRWEGQRVDSSFARRLQLTNSP
jgi:hypothetical protein